MSWPARSSDMNPIENLCDIVSRRVYGGGKQYLTVSELKDSIKREWTKLAHSERFSLIKSMRIDVQPFSKLKERLQSTKSACCSSISL